MQGSKEIFCRMREEIYNQIPSELRLQFSHTEVKEVNEWETHKDDPNYIELYSSQRKAKKALKDYLYNKRHNHKYSRK